MIGSKCDALLAAVAAEIEGRRGQIDGDDGLCTVGIIVKLDEKTGAPRQIIWRPESQRKVGRQEIRVDKTTNQPYIVTV